MAGGPGANSTSRSIPKAVRSSASELTTTEAGDAALVGPLLDRVTGPIASVTADGAYDGEPVYRAVSQRQPDPPAVARRRSRLRRSRRRRHAQGAGDHRARA